MARLKEWQDKVQQLQQAMASASTAPFSEVEEHQRQPAVSASTATAEHHSLPTHVLRGGGQRPDALFQRDGEGRQVSIPQLALVHQLYKDLDAQQLPRELARLRVLGEKVQSLADLPAVLANECPEQHGFASAPAGPLPLTSDGVRCTSCQKETPLEMVTDMLRHRPRNCKYAKKWLTELCSSSPPNLTQYRCTNCILDAAMAAGRLKRQGQLCSKSTELAWTQLKCGLRLPLACTFESGKLLVGCKRGIGALPTASGEGTVSYSVVVLNGEMCEQITGKAFWGTLLKGSEWDVGPTGAATALAGGLRMYSERLDTSRGTTRGKGNLTLSSQTTRKIRKNLIALNANIEEKRDFFLTLL